MSENNLIVGQNVILEVGEEDSREDFPAIVKKLKKSLVALLLVEKGLEGLNVPPGGSVCIKSPDKDKDAFKAISGIIIDTKAFPVIILKFDTAKDLGDNNNLHSVKDIPEVVPAVPPKVTPNLSDASYLSDRNSARVSDSFVIHCYPLTKEKAEQKKNEYLLRPTLYRREKEKIKISGTKPEVLEKVSHLDSDLQVIIMDIYSKIQIILGSKGPEIFANKNEDGKEAECVDISGSGLKIICDQKSKKGDILKMIIAPPNATVPFSVSALGEVKNIEAVKVGKETKYSLGLKYYSIHEQDMEQIVGYTFQLQREQLNLRRQLEKRR